MLNQNSIINYLSNITNLRNKVLNKLKEYSDGTLGVRQYSKKDIIYTSFFIEKIVRGKKVRESITKDEKLIKQMAKKRYYQEMLRLIDNNIDALAKVGEIKNIEIDDVMKRMPLQIQNMLEFEKEGRYALPADPEKAQMLLQWVDQPYVGNPKYPEHLKHTTSTGQLVRSKSEALIYEKLLASKIAFKYEAPIVLGGNIVYPDFSIMRIDNKIFYWEHAGCCFREDYRNEFDWKLKKYEEHGITLWDNLIVTFDDMDGNIDVRDIDSAIQNKLLI